MTGTGGAATVAMIARLKAEGATWAQIAPALGCPDARTAKATAKRLARQAQANAVRQPATPVTPRPALPDRATIARDARGWLPDLVHDRTVKIAPRRAGKRGGR